MSPERIRLGTRGSRLALVQADMVARALRDAHPGIEVTVEVIRTTGDLKPDTPIVELGSKGVFTSELESHLLAGTIDAAVHSLKDLSASDPEGLRWVGSPTRGPVRDVLLTRRSIRQWPAKLDGLVVGTSSPRRREQILSHWPSADVRAIRGNVPTRIRKLHQGEFDAIVLAEAGMERLQLNEGQMRLPLDLMLPAAGQGALALQARSDDEATASLLSWIVDPDTTSCCAAERAFLREIGAACDTPVAALAQIEGDGGRIRLWTRWFPPNWRRMFETIEVGSDPVELGIRSARIIMERIEMEAPAARGRAAVAMPVEAERLVRRPRIAVTRDSDTDGPLCRALAEQGMVTVPLPCIRIERIRPGIKERTALDSHPRESWIVVVSPRAAEGLGRLWHREDFAGRRFACPGESTAAVLRNLGAGDVLVPRGTTGLAALLQTILALGETVGPMLYVCGYLTNEEDLEALRQAGFDLRVIQLYRTSERAWGCESAMEELMAGRFDAVTVCSPSAARGLKSRLGDRPLPGATQLLAFGPRAAAELESLGLPPHATAPADSFESFAAFVAKSLPDREATS